jgi:hypothetical protein
MAVMTSVKQWWAECLRQRRVPLVGSEESVAEYVTGRGNYGDAVGWPHAVAACLLYRDYCVWCDLHGHEPTGYSEFFYQWAHVGYVYGRQAHHRRRHRRMWRSSGNSWVRIRKSMRFVVFAPVDVHAAFMGLKIRVPVFMGMGVTEMRTLVRDKSLMSVVTNVDTID